MLFFFLSKKLGPYSENNLSSSGLLHAADYLCIQPQVSTNDNQVLLVNSDVRIQILTFRPPESFLLSDLPKYLVSLINYKFNQ